MKLIKLIESEREDGKFGIKVGGGANPPALPPHRHIGGSNDHNDLYMQVVPKTHPSNLSGPDNKMHYANGYVALIGKRRGWEKQQARVQVNYEDIDEVIEALRHAKKLLEEDKH